MSLNLLATAGSHDSLLDIVASAACSGQGKALVERAVSIETVVVVVVGPDAVACPWVAAANWHSARVLGPRLAVAKDNKIAHLNKILGANCWRQ